MNDPIPNKPAGLAFWLPALWVVGLNFMPIGLASSWQTVRLVIVVGMFVGSLCFLIWAWRQRSIVFRVFLIAFLGLLNGLVFHKDEYNQALRGFFLHNLPIF